MSHPPSRRGLLGLAASGTMAATLPACGLPSRLPAVPGNETLQASVLGIPNERFYIALGSEPITREFMSAIERRRLALGLGPGQSLPHWEMLAISGGGDNGAFGAGLINGWTAHGGRPVFELVTGVSTGGLSAPFAYLGPEWDDALRDVYTGVGVHDIVVRRSIFAAVFNDGLLDTTPLYAMISRHLGAAMMEALAKAYDDGRLLLIGTTDLDAQTPVIWNIGAIAKSGHPRALDTIRRILLASASIPGAFPPVMFDVTVNGQQRQELHVDGGAFAQAFLYPRAISAQRRALIQAGRRVPTGTAYVIRNAKLSSDWQSVERRTYSIAGRAIATMIASSGYNDVVRIWNTVREDRFNYRLAYIGQDFTVPYTTPFNQDYMRALYDYGFQQGRAGYNWATQPPF